MNVDVDVIMSGDEIIGIEVNGLTASLVGSSDYLHGGKGWTVLNYTVQKEEHE